VRAKEGRGGAGRAAAGLCESPLFAGKRTDPTGGTRLAAAAGERRGKADWAGRRNWAGAEGTWAAEKEKKGERAGLENRVRKERVLQILKTLQFKFEFKNSNSNRTTSNKTMYCSMNATQQKKQPYLI
jgi:hypothetical protein